ncbi:hypothetical protein HWV62_23715 [Athelia sp. TMB]|nr:hypothetical protein HWV62_23715 [Athelia sp. TMB]
MTSVTESPKAATSPSHPYPANYPFPPGFPHGGFPPYYTYAPPPDGNGDNSGHHAPYMMPYPPPPGMVYAYQAPSQGFYQGESNGKQNKRRQVKMACTNCAAACKRCDEARPCERCIKYGLTDQCQDGTRKERKKGIKRGPYKRKNKAGASNGNASSGSSEPAQTFVPFIAQPLPANGDAPPQTVEWQHAPPPPPQPGASTDATTSAEASGASASAGPSNPGSAIQTVPQYGPPPEGYYPYYYPPMPPGFMPHPHAPGQEGSDGTVQPGSLVQFFPINMPPGAYPFPHFQYAPHPSQQPQQTPQQNQMQQQQTIDPKHAQIARRQESEEEAEEEEESSPVIAPPSHPEAPKQLTLVSVTAADVKADSAPSPTKKRTKGAKNGATAEPKVKKARAGKKSRRLNES